MKKFERVYPYTDCNGIPFRLVRSRVYDHEWEVWEQGQDAYGPFDRFVDDVDDCDTEAEAAEAWKLRVQQDQDAF